MCLCALYYFREGSWLLMSWTLLVYYLCGRSICSGEAAAKCVYVCALLIFGGFQMFAVNTWGHLDGCH